MSDEDRTEVIEEEVIDDFEEANDKGIFEGEPMRPANQR